MRIAKLLSATAMSLAIATGAHAADGNEAYVAQTGDGNSALVTQSGNNNDAGQS